MTDAIDASTLEITLMNLALGGLCIALVAVVLWGVIADLAERRRARASRRPRGQTSGRSGRSGPAGPRDRPSLCDRSRDLPDGWPPLRHDMTRPLETPSHH